MFYPPLPLPSAAANMATGPSEQSDVLQVELTCPVCLDIFHDPHLLPCGHNFCKRCLDRLRQLTDQSRFHCPECRDSHRCNRTFQKNFKLANIAVDFRRSRRAAGAGAAPASGECAAAPPPGRRERVPCDYCSPPLAEPPGGADAPQEKGDMQAARMAVKMCLKCEVSMCPEHVKPHLELPAFREHPLTEPVKDFWRRKCPDHDEIFRYYCFNDEMCLCGACTVEGQHAEHSVKTLRNAMVDIKRDVLHKQLDKIQKKYAVANKRFLKETAREHQHKKFLEDSEDCLARLRRDLEEKVSSFVGRLMEHPRSSIHANGPTIQKNISRVGQNLARLREMRCGIDALMAESDPFLFIEAFKTTGKQCRRLLKKNVFQPEYVEIDRALLSIEMEEEMQKFLSLELTVYIFAAINAICDNGDVGDNRRESEVAAREEDEDATEDEDAGDEDAADDSHDLDNSSEEELSDDEQEEQLSYSDDDLYIPEEDEEVAEEDSEDGEMDDHEVDYEDVEEGD